MAFDKSKEKTLKDCGTIVLAEEPEYQALHVRVIQYGNYKPKVAIQFEKTNWNRKEETGPETITMQKLPRFIGEDMDKICAKLPEMLEKARGYLEDPPVKKKPKKKKG